MTCSLPFAVITVLVALTMHSIIGSIVSSWVELKFPGILCALPDLVPVEEARKEIQRLKKKGDFAEQLCGYTPDSQPDPYDIRYFFYKTIEQGMKNTNSHRSLATISIKVGAGQSHAFLITDKGYGYEKFALAAMLITFFILFAAVIGTCGICCDCCETKCPAWLITICSTIATLLVLVTIIVYAVNMRKGYTFDAGFYITIGILAALLITTAISWISMILFRDLVQDGHLIPQIVRDQPVE